MWRWWHEGRGERSRRRSSKGEILRRGQRTRFTRSYPDFVVGDDSSECMKVDEDELTDGEESDEDHEEIQLGPGMESVEEGKVEGGEESHSDGF